MQTLAVQGDDGILGGAAQDLVRTLVLGSEIVIFGFEAGNSGEQRRIGESVITIDLVRRLRRMPRREFNPFVDRRHLGLPRPSCARLMTAV